MSRILIIIPAYNEAKSLRLVLERVKSSMPGASIAVINDGSNDDTGVIAEDFGCIALQLPCNMGVGVAEQTGFLYALRNGYDLVVRNDADGQHNPAEIPLLLQNLKTMNADVVIGSRYLEDRGYVTPGLRRMGIALLSKVISFLCGARFTDPTSGFRAFNQKAIQLCATCYPRAYPEPESVVLFRRAGLSVREIPVTMNPRYGGRSSIRNMDSAYYMFKVLLAILLELFRRAPEIGPSAAPGLQSERAPFALEKDSAPPVVQ